MKKFMFLLFVLLPLMPQYSLAQSDNDPNHGDPRDPVYREDLPPPPGVEKRLFEKFDHGQRLIDGVNDPHQKGIPQSRSISVTFTPGGVTNLVQMVAGYPTSITFLDSTGQPWPIGWDASPNKARGCTTKQEEANTSSVRLASKGISACVPEAGSNILILTPISRYPSGGVSVHLKGAPKPIFLMFDSLSGHFDSDLTVKVAARGPNASNEVILENDSPVTGAAFLTSMLDGTPPEEAVPLIVSGVPADRIRAWQFNHEYYLRTDYILVSPAPSAHTSEYGVTVYEIPESSKVLLFSNNKMISISLSEMNKP